MWLESPTAAEFKAFHQELSAAGVPTHVHLDVTYRCDLDCEHCYLDDKERWPEMKTRRLRDLLDELAELGVLHLVWSGGEVFARPDFDELLVAAGRLGFSSRVKTHGGNLTAERVSFLLAQGVNNVDISVYSLDADIHDAITRVPGSLERTLRGVQLCVDQGLHVRVGLVAMPSNVDELEDMVAYFQAMGADVGIGMRIYDDHTASGLTAAAKLTDEELVRARIAHMRAFDTDAEAWLSRPMAKSGKTCSAGVDLAYVTPDGSVWPCVMFPMAIGNLHEASFGEIWRTSAERAEVERFQQAERTDCHSCAAGGVCDYCKGEAFKQTGDFRKAPPSFHREAAAHLRALEVVSGRTLSAEAWATVPAGDVQPKRKAIFPIYRPGRHG